MTRRSRTVSPLGLVLLLVPVLLVAGGVVVLLGAADRPAVPPAAAPSEPPATTTGAPTEPTALVTDSGSAAPSPAEGDVLEYVAMGDSLASAGQGDASYVPALARHFEQRSGRAVDVMNAARSGWTTSDVLAAAQAEDMRAALRRADVVTLNAGGNDLLPLRLRYSLGTCGGDDGQACLRRGVRQFSRQWERLLDEVLAARGSSDGVAVANLYHPFVAAEKAAGTYAVTREHLDDANRRLRAAAEARGIAVADVHTAFNGEDGEQDARQRGLLGFDGVHPTPAGATTIAEAFAALDLIPLP